MTVVLLFPGGAPDALEHMQKAVANGDRVIGASSVPGDLAQSFYPEWRYLPYITNPDFEAALLRVLAETAVKVIYTRHLVIGRRLKELIEKHRLGVRLDTCAFAAPVIRVQDMLMEQVRHPFLLGFDADAVPALTDIEKASLLHHAAHIEGQSNEDKLLALMEIFRHCPKGDVVEIGTFWGRSAFLLGWLARKYDVGHMLCIDPWDTEAAYQEGVDTHLNDAVKELDFESAFRGFQLNLIPYNQGHMNYIRASSHAAWQRYKHRPLTLTTDTFGATGYEGKIACLHIDGNHDYQHVVQDISDWVPLVCPGGWVVIDDYQWAFGDAPKVAADAWMAKHQHQVALSFTAGSALFIKLRYD